MKADPVCLYLKLSHVLLIFLDFYFVGVLVNSYHIGGIQNSVPQYLYWIPAGRVQKPVVGLEALGQSPPSGGIT